MRCSMCVQALPCRFDRRSVGGGVPAHPWGARRLRARCRVVSRPVYRPSRRSRDRHLGGPAGSSPAGARREGGKARRAFSAGRATNASSWRALQVKDHCEGVPRRRRATESAGCGVCGAAVIRRSRHHRGRRAPAAPFLLPFSTPTHGTPWDGGGTPCRAGAAIACRSRGEATAVGARQRPRDVAPVFRRPPPMEPWRNPASSSCRAARGRRRSP